MKTLSDILRNADPLHDEIGRSAEARHRLRRAVLSAPRGAAAQRSIGRRSLFTAGAVVIAGIAVTKIAWPHASVDAVAAVRFEARLSGTGQPIVANRDILTARMVPGSKPGTYGVELTFTAEGAEKMRQATEAHIGQHLELLVDGNVVIAPVIRSVISTAATISGDYTQAEAMRIVDGLLKSTLEVRPQK